MSNAHSDSLHEAVQRALAAGDFDTVSQLSDPLGKAIVAELAAAAPADRVILFEQHIARLGEHLSLTRVLRAHLASQLHENTAACLYQPTATDKNSWRFDA
jgi:hypothetical protein